MVRRLKVLNTPQGEEGEAAERSPLAWIAIGAASTTILFLPLSMVGLRMGDRLVDLGLGAAAPALLLLMFWVSAWGSAAIAGRFGTRTTARHGAWIGAAGGLLTSVLAAPVFVIGWTVAAAAAGVLLALGAGAGFLGARFGIRRRPELG